jgi:hypothetical protein
LPKLRKPTARALLALGRAAGARQVTLCAEDYQAVAREVDIQRGICQYLDLRRIPFSITDASRTFGTDGKPRRGKVRKSWPDISGCLPGGRMLAVEVKTATGGFQPGQEEMLERLRRQGALVIVARSIDDVKRALETGR